MLTVDRNGTPIREGDTLMYCGTAGITSEVYKANEDLVPGGIVVVKFVDDDETFTANGWYAGDGYPRWFPGSEFEIVHEKEFIPDEVDFF